MVTDATTSFHSTRASLGDPASTGSASTEGLLVLSRGEIARLLSFSDYVDAVEAALHAAAAGRAVAPPASALHVADGSFHAKAGALIEDGGSMVAIKLNGNFPGNPAANGLPTVPSTSPTL